VDAIALTHTAISVHSHPFNRVATTVAPRNQHQKKNAADPARENVRGRRRCLASPQLGPHVFKSVRDANGFSVAVMSCNRCATAVIRGKLAHYARAHRHYGLLADRCRSSEAGAAHEVRARIGVKVRVFTAAHERRVTHRTWHINCSHR
jgi:hypothetical protein